MAGADAVGVRIFQLPITSEKIHRALHPEGYAQESREAPSAPKGPAANRLAAEGLAEPIVLPRTSQALYLVQRIRDEAHRFAITYHRNVRSKAGIRSALDDVPGVGPGRMRALLMHFGTARAVKAAALEDLEKVPGISRTTARGIYDYFHPGG